MVYQPKVTKNVYPKGVAKLTAQGSQIKVHYSTREREDGSKVNGDQSGKVYLVNEWPEYVDPTKISGEVVYAKLNKDGTKLFQVSPQDGIVKMRFTGFWAKEDQEPVPSAPKTDKHGNPYTNATALFEIVDGEDWMIGMPQNMMIRPSLFEADDEGNTTIRGLGNSRAILGPKLNEMLTKCGGWDAGPLPYVDNLLPAFQKRMLVARKVVQVGIQNGFVQNFWDTAADDDEFPDEFSEDETMETVSEVYSEQPEVTETESLFDEEDSDF